MTATVEDIRPPRAVIRILNPIMRTTLRTPLGRAVRSFALLEFIGRRSGRRFRVSVGWHVVDGAEVVFSPAPWRANFVDGHRVLVRHRGRTRTMTGTLVADASEVAATLASLLAGGAPSRSVGLRVPSGHTVTASDVVAVDRAMIRFT